MIYLSIKTGFLVFVVVRLDDVSKIAVMLIVVNRFVAFLPT